VKEGFPVALKDVVFMSNGCFDAVSYNAKESRDSKVSYQCPARRTRGGTHEDGGDT
jgi:hypothetical protein